MGVKEKCFARVSGRKNNTGLLNTEGGGHLQGDTGLRGRRNFVLQWAEGRYFKENVECNLFSKKYIKSTKIYKMLQKTEFSSFTDSLGGMLKTKS